MGKADGEDKGNASGKEGSVKVDSCFVHVQYVLITGAKTSGCAANDEHVELLGNRFGVPDFLHRIRSCHIAKGSTFSLEFLCNW